ncbi:hypothetical protein HPB48_026903 [Haemaphysalis longicornis]|uniref:DDE Tnp4 domain-containing protein n=1 Tax=Haemaphysalis longicornis TaxID=44386 RepID=A0A9J6HD08_HAELO|nr:hypothetical protein HPB48_026903 [Haemaphysalis longicornis]
MSDKGFRIDDLVEDIGAKLNIPPFFRREKLAEETQETQDISALRKHVERRIQCIRCYHTWLPPLLRQIRAHHVLGCFLEAIGLQKGNSPQHAHPVAARNHSSRAFTVPIGHLSVLVNCGYHALRCGGAALGQTRVHG